jgi:tRNA-dihydrouridine synthase
VERIQAGVEGVLVGRGVLRNPWILAQAADLAAGRTPRRITPEDRGRFLMDYIDLLLDDGATDADGFRHGAVARPGRTTAPASRARWVVNKIRALGSYYTKGLDNGGHLRTAINSAHSVAELRDAIGRFFFVSPEAAVASSISTSGLGE